MMYVGPRKCRAKFPPATKCRAELKLARIFHEGPGMMATNRRCLAERTKSFREGVSGGRAGAKSIAIAIDLVKPNSRRAWTSQGPGSTATVTNCFTSKPPKISLFLISFGRLPAVASAFVKYAGWYADS